MSGAESLRAQEELGRCVGREMLAVSRKEDAEALFKLVKGMQPHFSIEEVQRLTKCLKGAFLDLSPEDLDPLFSENDRGETAFGHLHAKLEELQNACRRSESLTPVETVGIDSIRSVHPA